MPALDWRGSGRRRVSLRLLTVCVVPLIVAADDQCPVSDAEGGGACIRTKEVDKDDLTGFIQNRLSKIINVRGELGVNSEDVTYLSKGRRIISIAVAFLLAAIAVAVYVHSLMQPPKSEDGDSSSPSRSSRDDSELSGGTASRGRRLLRRVTLNVEELQRPRKKTWTFEVALGTMSSKAFVINMFADLCAPGLLPLAYGMTGTGFLPGGILLVVFYGMCVYTMWAIGRTCLLTQKLNFAEQWAQEIGPRSAWVPVTVVVLVCFGCCLSYACFYADIFSGVMPAIGLPLDRSHCLLLFTVFPTMPLCLMKDLSALAPSSFCALIAVIYTTIVMVTRTIDGSYAPGGAFYDSAKMPTEPLVVSDHMMQFGIPSLTLVNNLAMAFLAHYNGCKYYRELESHTPTYLVKVTSIAMGISCVIFALCGYCGYMTFGSYSEGVILNNYAQDDWPINIARLGISFPIDDERPPGGRLRAVEANCPQPRGKVRACLRPGCSVFRPHRHDNCCCMGVDRCWYSCWRCGCIMWHFHNLHHPLLTVRDDPGNDGCCPASERDCLCSLQCTAWCCFSSVWLTHIFEHSELICIVEISV